MRLRHLAAATLATVAFATPAAASAHTTPSAHSTAVPTIAARCTTTSSGSCIRGGEFCPRSKYNQAGYDAYGRRYVCKGNRTHPHWMK